MKKVLLVAFALSIGMAGPGAEPDPDPRRAGDEKHGTAREIRVRASQPPTAGAILEQADLSKEYLLLFKWTGAAGDRITFKVEDAKEGQVVLFRMIPSIDKGKKSHVRLFAVPKKAEWRADKDRPNRLGTPVKITTAAELRKHFADKPKDDE